MKALAEIQAQVKEAERLERDATIRLQALLPPGTPVEFRQGNMACVHNGVVIRVSVGGWSGLGVVITNTDTGYERTVPVSALTAPHDNKAPRKAPVELGPPVCDLCEDGLRPGEDRLECPCGNIFVREGKQ